MIIHPLLSTLCLLSSTTAPPCMDRLEYLAMPQASHRTTPEVIDSLACLDALDERAIGAMLDSDDPRLIGIGIQAADRRRMLDLLLQRPRLADDARPTLPLQRVSVHFGAPPFDSPQSVRKFYRGMIEAWFGVTAMSASDMARYFTEGANAWDYARPWAVRLSRAALSDNPGAIAAVLDDLRTLPPEHRAIVVAWTVSMGEVPPALSLAEAKALLADTPPSFRHCLDAATISPTLPPDFALTRETFRKQLGETLDLIRSHTEEASSSLSQDAARE